MKAKRIVSAVLSFTMIFGQCVSTFADTYSQEKSAEEQLEQELRGSDENVEKYPNGQFEFLATRMNASEDLKSVEIAVVRKGGSKGEASVDLKAIDVSAKYGEDYVIKVGDSLFKKTLEENPNAKTIVEAYAEVSDIEETEENPDDIIAVMDNVESGQSVSISDIIDEAYDDEVLEDESSDEISEDESSDEISEDESSDEISEDESSDEISEDETSDEVLEDDSTSYSAGSGLRNARNAFTGEISDRKEWTEKQSTTSSELIDYGDKAVSELGEELEGVTTTLKFADGEYMKKITVEIIDDKISESDEQILFMLSNLTSGELGDGYKAFLNIQDNDTEEVQKYQMAQTKIEVSRDEAYAEITIKRTAGTAKFGSVYVSTGEITAKAGKDYQAFADEVVFPQNIKERTIKIPILAKTASQDGLQFRVMLDKSSEIVNSAAAETIVTLNNSDSIAKTEILSDDENYDDETGLKYDENGYYKEILVSQNEDGSIETLDDGASDKTLYNGNSEKNLFKAKLITLSSYNNQTSWSVNADLTGVKEVEVTWANATSGTYWETKKCKKVTSSGYYAEGGNWFKFEGSNNEYRPSSNNIKFSKQTTKITVPEDSKVKKTNGKITFYTKTEGNNKNSILMIYSIKLYYAPITVNVGGVGNSVSDNNTAYNAKVDIKEWQISQTDATGCTMDSANNTSYKVTQSTDAGELKFSSGNTQSQTGYYGKTFDFSPVYILDKNTVYLAGLYVVGSNGGQFYKGKTSITLDSDFFSKHKLYSGSSTVTVYPVYYPKQTFIYFPDVSGGAMASHNKTSTNVMKVSRLDTVKLQAVPNSGKFVKGFTVTSTSTGSLWSDSSFANLSISNFKFWFTLKAKYASTSVTSGITWNANDSSYITIVPSADIMKVSPYYSVPYLTVMANPLNKYKDKGAVYYVGSNNDSKQGDSKTPIVINPMDMGKTYTFNSIASDGYETKWQDFTGDTNKDGYIKGDEIVKGGEYSTDTSAVVGSTYNYVPKVFSAPLIYYGFYPEYDNGSIGEVSGYLYLMKRDVLASNSKKTPISGAKITVGNLTTETDETGYYEIQSSSFADAQKVMVSAYFDGFTYSFSQDVNIGKNVKIDEYDTLSISSAKLYKDSSQITASQVENFDSNLKISLSTKADSSVLYANKALFKTYDKSGNLICSDEVTSTDANGVFNYVLNPSSKGISPGSTMTVQLFDQNGKGYIVHDMGITFSRYLGTFDILTSFESPVKPALELIGSVDAAFGLGLSGKTDNYFSTSTKTENGKTVELKTLSIGFSKDWSSDSDTSKEESKLDKLTSKIKEAANKKSDSKEKKELKEEVKKATDSKEEKTKKSVEISAETSLTLSMGIDVVMQKSDVKEGEYFFRDLLFTVNCTASAGMQAEIPTPICVNIIIGFEVSGDVTGSVVISRGAAAKESYFDSNGGIDFGNMALLKKDEATSASSDFTFYGSLEVIPTIKLTAGVGISSVLKLTVSGEAKFDLNFDTLGNSSGDVTMSAYIGVKVLLFSKEWKLASTTINMFGLDSDSDILHDSVDSMEKTDISYMSKRGSWNTDSLELLDDGLEVSETTLLTGANPYPQSVIKSLGDGRYILVFIDDDISKDEYNYPTAKYSIWTDGKWSTPVALDNDETTDEAPDVFVLDNGTAVAVWSSAGEKITAEDNAIDALSKMNIKSAVFNSNGFGEPVEVTHTTKADYCADTEPKLASGNADGNDRIILYYTKTEYEATEGDGVIGDLVDPYSVTAYMFYDVASGKWINTYSDADKKEIIETGYATTSDGQVVTEDNFDVYESEWYGQGFVSLGSNAVINDTDVTDDEGYWTSMPTVTESENDTDPMIVDSDVISYNNLSIFAYTMDMDQSSQTTYDREIYVQVYDFDTNEFFYPIQITSNTVSDSGVKLGRFGNSTYLIWLSDGKIKALDFTNAYRDCLLEKEIGGNKVYIINKLKSENEYIPEITIADAGENTAISEFEIAGDKADNAYVLWTQTGLTYKDGVDKFSEEATKAENQYVENQIYMSKYTASDDSVYGKWSAPAQVTQEQGANYSGIAFFVKDGSVNAVATKGKSGINAEYGSEEDISTRVISALSFKDVERLEISEITQENVENDTADISVTISNNGTVDYSDAYVEFYSNGKLVDTEKAESFASGDETVIYAQVPTGNIEAKLYAGGKLADTTESEINSSAELEIDSVSAEIVSRDKAKVYLRVENTGSKDIENAVISVVSDKTNETAGQEEISLAIGESIETEIFADINEDMFEEITPESDEYSYEESAVFTVSAENSNSESASIERYITVDESKLLSSINPVLNDGEDIIEVMEGGYNIAYDSITSENNGIKAVWSSEDEDTAKVSENGLISGIKVGSTVLTAKIMPSDRTITVFSDGVQDTEDIYNEIPESGIIVKTIKVNVVEGISEETTETTTDNTQDATTDDDDDDSTTSNRRTSGGSSGGGSAVIGTNSADKSDKDSESKPDGSDNTSSSKVFDDVKGTWAEKAITELAERGIVSGTGNNKFSPERNVTRGEFITMLMNALNIDADVSETEQFADVNGSMYYSEQILKARALGIAEGYGNNDFKPSNEITRQEMFALIYRALKVTGGIETAENYKLSYTDSDNVSDYAKESIASLTSAGLVKGSDNLIRPLDNARRNETAQVIYNIISNME